MMAKWWDELDDAVYSEARALDVLHWPARAYAVRRWASSNLVHHSAEDLAAIALLSLVETVRSESFEFRGWRPLWGLVKLSIDHSIQESMFKKWANDTRKVNSYEHEDGRDPADVFTSLRVLNREGLLHRELADVVAVMSRATKILLAFRFYEEINLDKIGGMMGTTRKVPHRITMGACEYLLHQAKRRVVEIGPFARVVLPTIDDEHLAALEASAREYVFARYGTDVSSWLGWVQISYGADISYVLDMLDTGNHRGIKHAPPIIDRDADVEHLETLSPPPVSRADVMQRTGWGMPRSSHALAIWRRRHGIETPMNGAQASHQRRSFAA